MGTGTFTVTTNWAPKRLRVTTPYRLTVPNEDQNEIYVHGIQVVPNSDYRAPGACDRWGVRGDLENGPYRGDVVLRYEDDETQQFTAPILSLADLWYRLNNLMEETGVEAAGKLVHWMQRTIERDGAVAGEDIDALKNVLSLAEISWQEYRSKVGGSLLEIAVHVPQGGVLLVERREQIWGGGLGDEIPDPVEVELSILVKTPVVNPPEFIKQQIEEMKKAQRAEAEATANRFLSATKLEDTYDD